MVTTFTTHQLQRPKDWFKESEAKSLAQFPSEFGAITDQDDLVRVFRLDVGDMLNYCLEFLNKYASAKVMAEVVGQVYARVHGLSVIVARLGWCPRDKEHAHALSLDEFGKDVYFSPADAGRFFACAVQAEIETNYCVVFATSKPIRKARYDITAARDLLGYEPRDTWPAGTEIVYE